jgi:hypothetical protein
MTKTSAMPSLISELHVIEKQGLVILLDKERCIYESGYWPVAESDAVRLIGGMLYLHQTKAKLSKFGGIVLAHRREEEIEQYRGRTVFKFQATKDARGVAWKGANHPMACIGGVVDSMP